ncbi:hypothetical protein FCOIX_7728 [Fusarium coicis]|nr:hypothetical protein FCOIX_7728 [Fusarium coicis]
MEITPQYDVEGNRAWHSNALKYAEKARQRAITEQDDDIYIQSYTKKEVEDPTTPEEQIQAEADFRREQKPYLIIDTLGYRITRRYRGTQVTKLTAHAETRERALNHVRNTRHIAQWRQHVHQEIEITEEGPSDNESRPNNQTLETNDDEAERLAWEASQAYQKELATKYDCPDDINGADCECSYDHPWGKGTRRLQKTCLQLKVRIRDKWLDALVDSGADMNHISPNTVNDLKLPWRDKKKPYTVRDGEGNAYDYDNGQITREIDHLKVFVNGRNQGIDFDIIPVHGYDLILGYPWLKRYNPQFNWRTGQVNCEDHPSDDEDDSDNNETRSQTPTEDSSGVRSDKASPIPKGTQHKYHKGRTKRIRRTIATLKGQFRQLDHDLQEMKQIAEKESEERLKNVPVQYRIYQKLFQEELDTKLPQHTEYDIEIVLKEGKNPKFFPIYNLSRDELDTLKEWLNDMLRK